jgi:hypothetical protein
MWSSMIGKRSEEKLGDEEGLGGRDGSLKERPVRLGSVRSWRCHDDESSAEPGARAGAGTPPAVP